MQLLDAYPPRRSRRKAWIRGLAFLAVAAAAAAVWTHREGLLNRYHVWKQQRALGQAKEFILKGDAANAQVALQVAFAAVPGSPDAYRVAADMLEEIGAPQALRLREDVVQVLPSSQNDRLALINCALKFHDLNAARDALAGLTPEEASKPAALALALTFALDTENRPVADALLDRLRKLSPSNDDFKVAQAILRLRNPRPEIASAARRDLAAMAPNPKYALRVRRELMADAVLRRDYPAAKHWAGLVVADPQASFADRLHRANLELLIDHRPFADVYGGLSPLAAATAPDAAEFVRWLLAQQRAKDADGWISTLTPEMRARPPVMAASAETAALLKDWDRLTSLLIAGAWGPAAADPVHLAMAAHLLGTKGDTALQHQVWDQAIQAAGRSLSSLVVLDRLTGVWGFGEEAEKTLWAIAREFPDQSWAAEALYTVYHSRNDTPDLKAVMALMVEANPGMPRLRHDWALLTLLTNPSRDWDQPKQTLAELYRQNPADPFYATSYAFALAQAGKAADALAVVDKLTPQQREFSPRLPYLAYVYGVNRRRADVESMETRASGVPMLPEERMLFTEAKEASERGPAALPPLPKFKPLSPASLKS